MGSEMTGFVICLLVGALIAGMAVWQIRTGSVRLLHRYHYMHVDVSDQPTLAAESGRWLAASGVIVMLLGAALLLPQPLANIVGFALVVALLACIWMACRTIVKFNGSLFS